MPFINRGSVLLFLVCWEILSWVCWIVFLYFLRQLYSYLLCFVNMVNYTWFSSICPTFHSHDKPHFVIIWYHFQILLNLICYYFSKDYVLYVHGSHNGFFFFFKFYCNFFVWFWCLGIARLTKWIGKCSFLFFFWKNLYKIDSNSFLSAW